MDTADRCRYGTLLPRSFPHILEKILFHLDYESFKTCFEVSNSWKKLLTSESVQKKAKDVFSEEIVEDEMKLQKGASEGDTEMIRGLLSTNMLDINCEMVIEDTRECEEYTGTPLFGAISEGRTHAVELLLDRGARPNIADSYGRTPLYMTAELGFRDMVQLLIDRGANLNMEDNDKWTPLHGAATEGHKDIVKMLLDEGADPNVTNEDEETPFSLAFKFNREDIDQLLIEKGAKPHKEYYEWQLVRAIKKGDVKEVKRLLSAGEVDVNCDRSQPLREAVRIGHNGIVHLLLSSGANPNMEHDDEEESPLKLAIDNGSKDLVRILLDAGAEPDDKDRELIDELDSESDSDIYSVSDTLGKGKRQSTITKYFDRL